MKTIAALFIGAAFSALCQPYPAPGKLVDVGGYRVHLYCIGEGSPAVIIAGAGASFDWGLVQLQVARFARVCTYDRSGTAWSDPGPLPTCAQRAGELHTLLEHAAIDGPYVLVGHSVGAIVARLFTAKNPKQVAGMVMVDHAFGPSSDAPPPAPFARSSPDYDTPPVLISQAPVILDKVEDSPAFQRLPARDREMHLWAAAQKETPERSQTSIGCLSEAPASFIGPRPLVVVSQAHGGEDYDRMQSVLLALSTDSRQMVAENSSHAIPIERPDVVIAAIRQVVAAVRNRARLR